MRCIASAAELPGAELEQRAELDRAAERIGHERPGRQREDRQRLPLDLGDEPGPVG